MREKLQEVLSSKYSSNNFKWLLSQFWKIEKFSDEKSGDDISILYENRKSKFVFLEIETKSINRKSLIKEDLRKRFNDEFNYVVASYFNPKDKLNIWRLAILDISDNSEFNHKRYSYVLGENQKIKTPLKQLLNVSKNPKFDDLLSAFSVEQLTKEFYSHVFRFFEDLQQNIVFPDVENLSQDKEYFVVRLIGRLLFLKFLEQKNIIPSDKFQVSENYYHDVLEPLFFETLNKQNNQTQIPYLNGGLFQPQKTDFYDYNSPHQYLNSLKIPDEVFATFFENLQNYNFTIDENSTNEIEVSLDPELLGLVFENLLASINPETSETARKMSGSYYTPRQVVDFMVESSLFNFLEKSSKIEQNKLQNLIFKNDSNSLEYSEKIDILKYLTNIKIFDPAVGSGAFPMGILNKIVQILQTLDQSGEDWFKLQSNEFKAKHQNRDPDYIRKLSIIENSIFGSDIQPIAIEISKLRFFLSLVIEENDVSKIEPLPNLEFKFISSNSILPTSKPNQALTSNRYDEIQKEIRQVTKNYFFTSDKTEKELLKNRFNELKQELNLELDLDFDNNLAEFDPFDLTHTTPFFDANLMFNLNSGFDIVIGNPPYIRQEKIKHLKDQLKKSDYESFNGTADIYIYFYELGLKNLSENGVLSFITSNKWTRAKYGKSFRKLLLEKTQILNYIDFNGVKVFENATVDTSIISFSKRAEKSQKESFIFAEITEKLKPKERLFNFVEKSKSDYSMSDLSEESFSFANPEELKIKKKIEDVGTPLKDWDIKINYGIKTGFNEAFIVNTAKKEEILNSCTSSEERTKTESIFKKLLRGRDIKRYSYEWADLWIISTFPSLKLDIDEYPAIKNYLLTFGKRLEQTGEKGSRKKTGNKWYETQDQIAYLNEFEKEKIVYPDIGNLTFSLDYKQSFFNNTVYFLNTSSKYILSILNSKVISYWYGFVSSSLGEKGSRAFKIYIEKLPIPKPTEKSEKVLSGLVEYVLFAKEQGKNEISQLIESVIDSVVFGIYFEESMKKAECYILDEVDSILDKSFDLDTFYKNIKSSKTITSSLLSRRTVHEVKMILGD